MEDSRFPIPVATVADGILYTTRGYRCGPYSRSPRRLRRRHEHARCLARADRRALHLVARALPGPDLHGQRARHRHVSRCEDRRTVWQERAGGIFTASPVAGDGKIYLVVGNRRDRDPERPAGLTTCSRATHSTRTSSPRRRSHEVESSCAGTTRSSRLDDNGPGCAAGSEQTTSAWPPRARAGLRACPQVSAPRFERSKWRSRLRKGPICPWDCSRRVAESIDHSSHIAERGTRRRNQMVAPSGSKRGLRPCVTSSHRFSSTAHREMTPSCSIRRPTGRPVTMQGHRALPATRAPHRCRRRGRRDEIVAQPRIGDAPPRRIEPRRVLHFPIPRLHRRGRPTLGRHAPERERRPTWKRSTLAPSADHCGL